MWQKKYECEYNSKNAKADRNNHNTSCSRLVSDTQRSLAKAESISAETVVTINVARNTN